MKIEGRGVNKEQLNYKVWACSRDIPESKWELMAAFAMESDAVRYSEYLKANEPTWVIRLRRS